MIAFPSNQEQENVLAAFMLKHANVKPTPESRHIGWVNSNPINPEILAVVVFNNFIGSTCQSHLAMKDDYHYSPKEMLATVFDIVFNRWKLKTILGVINSLNENSMRFNQHLGFVEQYRLKGAHDDGGDMVWCTMTPETCRYISKERQLVETLQ
jgi:RimJ/RimL family protein N-acetyltransferase